MNKSSTLYLHIYNKNQISSELLHSPDISIMILRWKNQSSEHQEGEVLLHSRMDIHQPLTISTRKCKKGAARCSISVQAAVKERVGVKSLALDDDWQRAAGLPHP